jgi:acyl-CoA synthetase (AMP-forming)/AMP-acid ligase II
MTAPLPETMRWCARPRDGAGAHVLAGKDRWDFHGHDALAAGARAVAAWLHRDVGLAPGDVVGIIVPPGPDFIRAYYGAMAGGCVPCALPEPYAFAGDYPRRAAAMLESAGAAAVVMSGDLEWAADSLAPAGGRRAVPLPPAGSLQAEELAVHPAGPALAQFSSGSSGGPHLVPISWANLEAQTAMVLRWLEVTPDDCFATWLPPHHDMGLIGALLAPLRMQLSLRIMTPAQFIRSPLDWLRCLGALGGTITATPVFGLRHVLAKVSREQLADLDFGPVKAMVIGAERLDEDVLADFAGHLGGSGLAETALLPAYGLAEATLAVSGRPLGQARRTARFDPRRLSLGEPPAAAPGGPDGQGGLRLPSSGRPLDGVTVTIHGADGRPVAEGRLGEIAISGPSVAVAGPPGEPLRTGDAGFVRDGELYVLGRMGSSIKVRGRSIFAEDLEAVLAEIPGCPRRAVVVLDDDAGEPRATLLACADDGDWVAVALKRMAEFLGTGGQAQVTGVPRTAIPYTTSGKPRRRVLWQLLLGGAIAEQAKWTRQYRPGGAP